METNIRDTNRTIILSHISQEFLLSLRLNFTPMVAIDALAEDFADRFEPEKVCDAGKAVEGA